MLYTVYSCLFVFAVIICSILIYNYRVSYYFSKYENKYFRFFKPYWNYYRAYFGKSEHPVKIDCELRKAYSKDRFVGRAKFFEPVIVLQDLELIRKVTVKHFDSFMNRNKFGSERFGGFTANSLYFLKNEKWKNMRSTISPAFSNSRVKLMIPFMESVAKDVVDVLSCEIKKYNGNSLQVNVKKLALDMVNEVIANCVFGIDVNSYTYCNKDFCKMGNIVAETKEKLIKPGFNVFSIFSYFRKIIDMLPSKKDPAQKYFYDLLMDAIKKRESSKIERNDMVHLLIRAKKGELIHDDKKHNECKYFGFASVGESEYGRRRVKREWSDIHFAAQAITFHGNGYVPIATALSFALHEIALQNHIQNSLVQEIKNHHNKYKSVTFQSIQNMKYMDMVVSETLRLWPPITHLERISGKDYNLGKPNSMASENYTISSNRRVRIPVWAIHRDPNLYSKPEKFNPERFNRGNVGQINPQAYLPFGKGPRNCIGSKFALCALKIMLYYILLHLKVSPSESTCKPSKLCPKSRQIQLENGHWLKFKIRS